MEILVTGALGKITSDLSVYLAKSNKVVMVSEKISYPCEDKCVRSLEYSYKEDYFEDIFRSYDFDIVIYSMLQNTNADAIGSIDEMEAVLKLCQSNGAPQVIVLSSTKVYSGGEGITAISETTEPKPGCFDGFMLSTAESVCHYYRKKFGLPILIIHIPYIYSINNDNGIVGQAINEAISRHTLTLPGNAITPCDFVNEEDLKQLIWRIIDEGFPDNSYVLNVSSGFPIYMGDFAEFLEESIAGVIISYSGDEANVPAPVPQETARSYYGWIGLHRFEEDLPAILKNTGKEQHPKQPILQRIKEKITKVSRIPLGLALELTACMAITELLARAISGSSIYSAVDVRLLFIVIIGSLFGMKIGIIAVFYACISLIISGITQSQDWRILVYNSENWIPYIIYLVAGVVSGYTRDKSVNQRKNQKEQMDSLENNFMFMYDLYLQTLSNKARYRDQILGYRDSFGRIFNAVQKLDSLVPDEVFTEAIYVFEDILDNHSIAIYSVSRDGEYARLVTCSREQQNTEPSLSLAKYSNMIDDLYPSAVWFNRELLQDYPMYCAPVYDGEKLSALVMIYSADTEQTSGYYMNLVRVLTGLVQSSLLRAAKYFLAIENKRYIRYTRILREDAFLEAYETRRKMEDAQISEFALLRVKPDGESLSVFNKTIRKHIREVDIIGSVNGYIYIMLIRATISGVASVIDRLSGSGLQVDSMDAIDKLRAG